MAQTPDRIKILIIAQYIQHERGILIRYIQPPRTEDQRRKMDHMYHIAKTRLIQMGVPLAG